MSDMIERVAKALAHKRYVHCGGSEADTLVAGKPNWTFCLDDAHAVIEAMREPTERMLDSGACYEDQDHRFIADGDISRDIWRAMVSAALQPATDTGEAK
jgi:hypothetical protein